MLATIAALTCLLLPPSQSQVRSQDPGSEQSAGAPDRADVRAQYLRLAPLLTMSDPWRLEDLNLDGVIQALDKIAEYRSMSFDSDPVLKEVGPPVVEFMCDARLTIVPGIRASRDPTTVFENPEGVLVALFVEHASRYMENQVLREWQRACDRLCQSSWNRLLPLSRTLAGPLETKPLVKISVTGSGAGAQLFAQNVSERALSNTVLAVRMTSVGDESMDHVYFIEAWAPGSSIPLRVAVDWWQVGAARTVGGNIEVIADEARTAPRAFTLPENVVTAVQATMFALDAKWKAKDVPAALKLMDEAIAAAGKSKSGDVLKTCRAKLIDIRADLAKQRTALEKERDLALEQKKKADEVYSNAHRTAGESDAKKLTEAARTKIAAVEAKLAAVRKLVVAADRIPLPPG